MTWLVHLEERDAKENPELYITKPTPKTELGVLSKV
jgi:hypothetical protein